MRHVAHFVDDLRPPQRAGDQVARRKAHDRAVPLRLLASVHERTRARERHHRVVCGIAHVKRAALNRGEITLLQPLNERFDNVLQVVAALADKRIHHAHRHRTIVRPVAGRQTEDGTCHHLRDPRMRITPRELNGASTSTSYCAFDIKKKSKKSSFTKHIATAT